MMSRRIYLYDSTLRDGQQTQGVDFSVEDKRSISLDLDALGIDYIEGGFPGANLTDDAFFSSAPKFSHARLSGFGMTRRSGVLAQEDGGLQRLISSGVSVACLVGKSWSFQVKEVLGVDRDENLSMIYDSVSHMKDHVDEVIFDAEHFFDGYEDDASYALACLSAARDAGARWLVLCDTNGGILPMRVGQIVSDVVGHIDPQQLGCHFHDDTGNAVANSLIGVHEGVHHVQGTLNGLGERCGNANLICMIPNLCLKQDYQLGVSDHGLSTLTDVARRLDDRLNRFTEVQSAYVGAAAFAHKGGLHVSAMEKNSRSYEHISPDLVGNRRRILVSDQSGRSVISQRLESYGFSKESKDCDFVDRLLSLVKDKEHQGYSYDMAQASFELLVYEALGLVGDDLELLSFRVIDDHGRFSQGECGSGVSEATVKVLIQGHSHLCVAEGLGPVHALDCALREGLSSFQSYRQVVENIDLFDFKVRILSGRPGTQAAVRVMIESRDDSGFHWSTVGVSSNIIQASSIALMDSLRYKLLKSGCLS